MIGLLNSSINYLVFSTCLIYLEINYIFAGGLGFISAVIPAYIFNSIWTFNQQKISLRSFLKYITINFFLLGIHFATIFVAVNYLSIPEILSQLFGIAVTTIINFILIKKIVYKL